ncbi:UNVERIFIED_CONTAM: hypothetical protein Scaly_3118600 [Sesamum calycinum]|uniref:Uncharacterized protein n=1 Tax=Sesamum calycinum TaxID=2727403 RepID=A0AAW2JKW4_9LAMI
MTAEEGEHKQQWWNLFVDGSSTLQGSGKFERFELQRVPRLNNEEADQLVKLASSLTTVQNRKITLLTQEYAVIEDPANEVLVSTSKPCWKDTIEANLTTGSLPTDRKEARTIRTRATRFTMIGGELYKRGFSQPYLKCLDPERAEYVLREVHEGSCGNHSGERSLADHTSEEYWRRMAKAYNARVHQKSFQVGDLVWRRSDVQGNIGKLDAKWEGPYRVIEATGNATYKLEKLDGKEIPRGMHRI